jgi:hypothetical protein
MFCQPMELMTPEAVSTSRGCGFPSRGFKVVPLQIIAPSLWTSKNRLYSVPYPKVPEAVITGLARGKPFLFWGANCTDKSGFTGILTSQDSVRKLTRVFLLMQVKQTKIK